MVINTSDRYTIITLLAHDSLLKEESQPEPTMINFEIIQICRLMKSNHEDTDTWKTFTEFLNKFDQVSENFWLRIHSIQHLYLIERITTGIKTILVAPSFLFYFFTDTSTAKMQLEYYGFSNYPHKTF